MIRPFLVTMFLTHCALSPAALCKAETSERPNVVFILADDIGWNDIGAHSSVASPGLDTSNVIKTPNKGTLHLHQHWYSESAFAHLSRLKALAIHDDVVGSYWFVLGQHNIALFRAQGGNAFHACQNLCSTDGRSAVVIVFKPRQAGLGVLR